LCPIVAFVKFVFVELRDAMKVISVLLASAIISLIFEPLAANAQRNNVLVIVDFSGSMNEKSDGEIKIVAAKKAFRETMLQLQQSTNVGLMVFGQTRLGKHCDDISLLSSLGQRTAKQLAGSIDILEARGWTPIADSLLRARPIFANLKGDNNSVVLITDGREECGGNVCAAADELKAMGVGLKVHIVGLGQKHEDRMTVECAAKRTGGKYVAAVDARSLKDALEIVFK
jgi:Ca-activated chloride channel homolog